jgi:DNA-binding PadR family transcriptional regulator
VSEDAVRDASRIVEELVREEKLRQIVVLLYLLHTGHAIENDLRRAMTGGRYPVATHVARAVLSDLLDAKLVEMIRVGRYKVYRLTDLGRRVAEELAQRAGLA